MGTRDLSRDDTQRFVAPAIPLNAVGVHEDRVRRAVPFAHEPCARLDCERWCGRSV